MILGCANECVLYVNVLLLSFFFAFLKKHCVLVIQQSKKALDLHKNTLLTLGRYTGALKHRCVVG